MPAKELTVYFTCKQCGLEFHPCPVRARESSEKIEHWTLVLIDSVKRAHFAYGRLMCDRAGALDGIWIPCNQPAANGGGKSFVGEFVENPQAPAGGKEWFGVKI